MKFIVLAIIGALSVSINAEKQLSLQHMNACEANGGYVRDPNNCRCFYQCEADGNVWHLCCPVGQAFDDTNRVCILENPMICDSYRSLVVVKERPSTDCYAPEGLFKHEDCSKFWHCSYNHLYEMSCPEGTLWNDVIKNCVLPQYSTCNTFVLNSLQTNNLNAILNDITLSNLRMHRQQIYDKEMIDYQRDRSGERYLEDKLNEHLSEAILNNKWLSSVTYITLDPTGKVIYGITKISKLSLEEVDPNGNYSHPDFGHNFGFRPTLEKDLNQQSMNETEPMGDEDEDYDLTTQASIDSNSTTTSTDDNESQTQLTENNENTSESSTQTQTTYSTEETDENSFTDRPDQTTVDTLDLNKIIGNIQFETSTKTEEPVTETSVGTDDTTTGSSDNSKDTTDGETNENNDSGDNEKIETSSNTNIGSTEEESPEKTTDLDENMSSSTQTIESVTQINEMSNYSNTEFNENTEFTELNTESSVEKVTKVIESETNKDVDKDYESMAESAISTSSVTPGSSTDKPSLGSEDDSMLLKPNREICKEVGGSYQDENDCKCFYVCDLAYRPSRHCCPDGLVFNENADEVSCDYPDDVICKDGSNKPLRLKRAIYYRQNFDKIKLNHLKFK